MTRRIAKKLLRRARMRVGDTWIINERRTITGVEVKMLRLAAWAERNLRYVPILGRS